MFFLCSVATLLPLVPKCVLSPSCLLLLLLSFVLTFLFLLLIIIIIIIKGN